MINLPAIALTVGVLLAAPQSPSVPDEFGLDEVAEAMRFPGVRTTWQWKDCGIVNAFYYPRRKDVTLCNELRPFGRGFVRFVLAHELAHGVIHQKDIPYTGSGEAAADELAAVVLGVYGWSEDVDATAAFWNEHPQPENPADPHPSHARRYYTLSCLAAQSRSEYPFWCDDDGEWLRALRSWVRLLGV